MLLAAPYTLHKYQMQLIDLLPASSCSYSQLGFFFYVRAVTDQDLCLFYYFYFLFFASSSKLPVSFLFIGPPLSCLKILNPFPTAIISFIFIFMYFNRLICHVNILKFYNIIILENYNRFYSLQIILKSLTYQWYFIFDIYIFNIYVSIF